MLRSCRLRILGIRAVGACRISDSIDAGMQGPIILRAASCRTASCRDALSSRKPDFGKTDYAVPPKLTFDEHEVPDRIATGIGRRFLFLPARKENVHRTL